MRIVLKTVLNQPYAGMVNVKKEKIQTTVAKTVDALKVKNAYKIDAFLIYVEMVFVNLNSTKITTLASKIAPLVARTTTAMA